MFERILSDIDIFAPSVNFTFKEKHRHGTVLGGCCTLISFLIIIMYIMSLSLNTGYVVSTSKKALTLGET
jgi:hypothetical protein